MCIELFVLSQNVLRQIKNTICPVEECKQKRNCDAVLTAKQAAVFFEIKSFSLTG